MRTIWFARVPDEVSVRRPSVPAWPFLAVGTVSFGLFATLISREIGWLAVPVAALAMVPAVFARDRPALAATCSVGVNLLLPWLVGAGRNAIAPAWFLNVAPPQLLTAYTVGLAVTAPAAFVVVGAVVVSGAVFVEVAQLQPPITVLPAVLAWAALLVVATLLGDRRAHRHTRALEELADGERRRVQEERDRIARELHDVVAHHMSVIAVRSVSASRRISDLPDAAVAEFRELAAAARESLGELRQLLGALHGHAEPELEPQPGLDQLQRLTERAAGAGTPVELSVDAPPGLSAATAVSAYRIVQEALSNVTRHATGARTRVCVRPDGGGAQLVVEVGNEPAPSPPSRSGPGGGHGLAGMRERVRLLGGVFSAGPTPSGGFAVRAELPLEPVT